MSSSRLGKPSTSDAIKLPSAKRKNFGGSRKKLDHHSEKSTSSNEDESPEELVSDESSDDSELDIDGPRIVQWQGGDEDEDASEVGLQKDKSEGSSRLPDDDISSLSYGSLLKARQVLDKARVEDDSDRDDDTDETADNEAQIPSLLKTNMKKREKRAHKHAPTEMSSKRPVTRRRQVVEVKKPNYRDPRFSSLTDDSVRQSFHKNYGFWADLHHKEFETLKENLRRARNMVRSAPRDQREAWEEEVNRLERACKRAESAVNRNRKESVERQAIEQVRREEKERRKTGKGEWYMKKSAKKELLLKAHHDALATSGGRLAVRKVIEKRQKKVSQKEKKRRPSFVETREPNKRRKF